MPSWMWSLTRRNTDYKVVWFYVCQLIFKNHTNIAFFPPNIQHAVKDTVFVSTKLCLPSFCLDHTYKPQTLSRGNVLSRRSIWVPGSVRGPLCWLHCSHFRLWRVRMLMCFLLHLEAVLRSLLLLSPQGYFSYLPSLWIKLIEKTDKQCNIQ